MIDLTIRQVCGLWSELESAYYGANGYGGNVAKVYLFRCLHSMHSAVPVEEIGKPGSILGEIAAEAYDRANESLSDLIALFIETHSDARVTVDGRKFGRWLASSRNVHRVHVSIERVEPHSKRAHRCAK